MPKTRRVISSSPPEPKRPTPTRAELFAMARAAVPKSIERLQQIIDDESAPASVRADAAKFLARYGYAQPKVLH